MGWDEVMAEDFLYEKATGRIAPDVTYEEWLADDDSDKETDDE